jgi:hypothetical protein
VASCAVLPGSREAVSWVTSLLRSDTAARPDGYEDNRRKRLDAHLSISAACDECHASNRFSYRGCNLHDLSQFLFAHEPRGSVDSNQWL